MKDYEIYYNGGRMYMVCDNDHVVADQLTEQEAIDLRKSLTQGGKEMKITTEKFMSKSGNKWRRIIAVPNFKRGTDDYHQKTAVNIGADGNLHINYHDPCWIKVGEEFPESMWVQKLPRIKEAHARYLACEAKRRELERTWKGQETFVI